MIRGAPPAGGSGAVPAPVSAAAPEASLTRRLAALAYESVLYAALVLVVGFLTIPLTPQAPGAPELRVPGLPARVLGFALVFGVGAAYCGWSWTGARRTLAMKTWHLRLERAQGGAPGARTALVRYLAAWIGPALAIAAYVALRGHGLGAHAIWLVALNFLWAFVDPERRFLHDRVAGTRLVMD